jgi:hypothetical protein
MAVHAPKPWAIGDGSRWALATLGPSRAGRAEGWSKASPVWCSQLTSMPWAGLGLWRQLLFLNPFFHF